MISRLLTSRVAQYFFATAPNLTRVGGTMVSELPEMDLPTKPKDQKWQDEERLSSKIAYDLFGYKRKDHLPNCRYFAVEYRNRIYHFYNAYYYPMGRMIDRVATQIRGKNSPHYKNHTAQVKHGDICVIVNIEDPLITGKKLLFKKFRYHTGFVGHLREQTYRQVLNTKPELLYHHMLRRTMPKNKLSQKYMENVVLCRGPTHNLPNFPQFAPDHRVYEQIQEVNLLEMVKNDPGYQLVSESKEGAAEEALGRKFEQYRSERDIERARRESAEEIQDLTKIHEDVPEVRMVSTMTPKQERAIKRKEKRIEQRYKHVRAPFNKKKLNVAERGLKYYRDEKKMAKDPDYELFKNEDLEQVDEQFTAPFPLEYPNKPKDGKEEDGKDKKQ